MTELAVFDMAGTTIDDRDEVYRVLREATEREGAKYTDSEFQQWMGTEKRWAIRNLLQIGGVINDATVDAEDLVESAWQWFRAELRRTYAEDPPTPLPGVEDALRRLRSTGVRIALTTGFSREITDIILAGIGWDNGELIDVSVAGDEVSDGRPAPLLIQAAMRELCVDSPSDVVNLGDTASDIRSAIAAGVAAIGVLTGHLSEQELLDEGAVAVLSSAALLPESNLVTAPESISDSKVEAAE